VLTVAHSIDVCRRRMAALASNSSKLSDQSVS
jgi:hypothetical protein